MKRDLTHEEQAAYAAQAAEQREIEEDFNDHDSSGDNLAEFTCEPFTTAPANPMCTLCEEIGRDDRIRTCDPMTTRLWRTLSG